MHNAQGSADALIILLTIVIGLFLPMIVASVRRHKEQMAINVLTCVSLFGSLIVGFLSTLTGGLFTMALGIAWIWGVGFIGWVIALVWSCTSNVRPDPKAVRAQGLNAVNAAAGSRS
jgi:hypothetical protein